MATNQTFPQPIVIMATVCLLIVDVQAEPFADHVVYNWDGATARYTPGGSDNMTFGPFHSSGLWNDPQAILGQPNLLDYDDTTPWSPLPGGGYGPGALREIHCAWPAWYKGSTDLLRLDTRPDLATQTNNGVGLQQGGQVVVEFDHPVMNDPTNPYGVDFIVHGNSDFATQADVYADTNMNTFVLSAFGGGGGFGASGPGAVFEERVTVSVAQSLDGPWYEYSSTFGDWFFPTQPLKWDREAINPNTGLSGDWTDQQNDWTRPVNPAMVDLAGEAAAVGTAQWGYLGNRTVADALDLYAGSAGGTPFDLAESGFAWIKYVKCTDPTGNGGEICGVADAAPVPIGEPLTMTWHNVHETGMNRLDFVAAAEATTLQAAVEFNDLNVVSYVTIDILENVSAYAQPDYEILDAYDIVIEEVFASEGDASFDVDLSLRVDDTLVTTADDLRLLLWEDTAWQEVTEFSYNGANQLIEAAGCTGSEGLVLAICRDVLAGDSDRDGDVDSADLATLGLNWDPSASQKQWTDGDYDADGDVDAADLARLGLHWSPGGYAIPEPASAGFCAVALAFLARRRKR